MKKRNITMSNKFENDTVLEKRRFDVDEGSGPVRDLNQKTRGMTPE